MKKFLSMLICALLVTFSAICFTACADTVSGEAVKLVAVTGEQVGLTDDIDYYVVAEPAASAKVNAIANLNFTCDLQQLYGGENGYPQAVIVAKTQLLTESSFVSNFVSALHLNADWLANENTTAESVFNAVQNHLTDGMSSAFTAKNLTKQVIANCKINFVSAQDCKEEIIEFMQKLNNVSETPFGTPSENFFWYGNCGSADYNGNVSVYAPDGAPALGMANLLAGEAQLSGGNEVKYEIVDASIIQTFVTGQNPQADICVLPVNLAVKLLGGGQNYKLVGTLTHGNLFMVSNNKEQITVKNLNSLKSKTVGVVNLPAIPGLMFKLILKDNGLEYVEII